MITINTLRAVANRLTSAPISDLPHLVGYLATSLASCKSLLQQPAEKNDHGVLLHKIRTRVSALLQDRSVEGRLAGIIIAKALIEAGGINILSESGNWVRAIISCLNKPDPVEVKKLAIVTVTRIYLLTAEHQQLVREITTPTLPAFVSSTLGAIKPSTNTIDGKDIRALNPLLEVSLRSWNTLIENFSSTIRPNAHSLKSICLSLVSDDACPKTIQRAASQLLAKLHYCAPRATSTTEWAQSCSQLIEAAHDTLDLVLRAVVEDWKSVTNHVSKVTKKQKSASIPSTDNQDIAGLEPWSGVSDGCGRLSSHIDLLRHFLTTKQNSEMRIPTGLLFDLTTRLSSITIPTPKYSPRTNNEITREEREELWLNLPRIHKSLLELYQAMIIIFGQTLGPLCNIISSQVWDIFEAEHSHPEVRTQTYQLMTLLLRYRLLRFHKPDSTNVKLMLQCIFDDLSPSRSNASSQSRMPNGTSGTNNSKSLAVQSIELTPSKRNVDLPEAADTVLFSSAWNLLPAMLIHANLHDLEGSSSIRAQIDAKAILLNHHEAILASVLYPAGSKISKRHSTKDSVPSSLIPFLARSADQIDNNDANDVVELGYEVLLRPRMPIVTVNVDSSGKVVNNNVADEGQDQDYPYHSRQNQHQSLDNGTDTIMTTEELSQSLPNQNASEHSLENPTGSMTGNKRDFTTLLEQSADAQLAASNVDYRTPSISHPADNLLDVSSFSHKRQKGDSDHEQGSRVEHHNNGNPTAVKASTLPVPNVTEPAMASPSNELPPTATMPLSVHEPHEAAAIPPSYPATSSVPSSSTNQAPSAKKDDDYDSDDSEVPPINATLAGFTDSEDEDDDEDDVV